MFEDSMITLMVMLLLCFVGMLIMFLFVIRSNTAIEASLKEMTRQVQAHLADIERQLMEINYANRSQGKTTSASVDDDISSLLGSIGDKNSALRGTHDLSNSFGGDFSGQRTRGLAEEGLPNLSLSSEFGPTLK